MKDTFRLVEWILEASRLNRAITCHLLPVRNAASVHLDCINPGACRPDHLYFRPPSLASVREEPGALQVKGAETCLPLRPPCAAQPPHRAVIVAGLEEQRGFGDICHFSERSLGCVSGGEGRGQGAFPYTRRGAA